MSEQKPLRDPLMKLVEDTITGYVHPDGIASVLAAFDTLKGQITSLQQENERLKIENKTLSEIETQKILIVDAQDKQIADLTSKLEAAERNAESKYHIAEDRQAQVEEFHTKWKEINSERDFWKDRAECLADVEMEQADRIRTLESLLLPHLKHKGDCSWVYNDYSGECNCGAIRAALPKTEHSGKCNDLMIESQGDADCICGKDKPLAKTEVKP